MRLYTSAVRRGVRVPQMLTLDDRFEEIVADAMPEAKMQPYREPEPEPVKPVPAEHPEEGVPAEEKPAEEK